ncbi:hypothetical protein [Flavobacterium sp. SOK18b]|uniref:hypothetical protein n=1 Tax=Flavobacterium sp. SOK18b TaxID=797900 RepID=UPI0015FAE711|nr:hypothetical protein [Flavobacterium sp. SOK18b]
MKIKRSIVAPMEAASPDIEKQGFFAVVFIYREYSAQRDELSTKQKSDAPKNQHLSIP